MEPTDLNPPPHPNDARIEAWLRQPATSLPDDGFSARVVAALPPPAPARVRRSRTATCAVGAAIGTVIAIAGFGSSDSWVLNWIPMRTAFEPLLAPLSDPVVLSALTVAGLSVLYAFRPNVSGRLAR